MCPDEPSWLFYQLASAVVVPSGADDSQAMVNALTSFVPFSSPTVALGPGTFRWNNTVPAFLRSTPAKVIGSGKDKTIIQLSATAPRAFDFSKVADFDTFSKIEIADLTVDRNNVSTGLGAGSDHILIGSTPNGATQLRLNFADIMVRRVKVTNVPHLSNGALTKGINLLSQHAASNEATQTTILDITLEDYECYGANQGAFIGGSGTSVSGQGVNVFYDRIRVKRYRADTLLVGNTTTFSDANLQIGSAGFGGSAHVEDIWGAGSGDVACEIDAATTAMVENGEFVDPVTASVLFRNFRAPLDLAAQRNVARNITARNVNTDPGAGGTYLPKHFRLAGDNSTAGFVFGHAVFENCTVALETALASYNAFGLALWTGGAQVRKVTVDGFTVAAPNLNLTLAASQTNKLTTLDSTYPGAEVKVRNMTFVLGGTRTVNANTITWQLLRIASSCRADVDGISVDCSGFANTQTGDRYQYVTLGDSVVCTIGGSIKGVRAAAAPAAVSNHNGLLCSASTSLTIAGWLLVSGFDMAQAATMTSTDVNVGDATNQAKVWIRDYQTAKASTRGPLNAATVITVGASPFTYTNTDMVRENVTIAGGTVSSVVLGQGGNVTVGIAGTYGLRPGDTLVVTYTVAPTMTKSPVV